MQLSTKEGPAKNCSGNGISLVASLFVSCMFTDPPLNPKICSSNNSLSGRHSITKVIRRHFNYNLNSCLALAHGDDPRIRVRHKNSRTIEQYSCCCCSILARAIWAARSGVMSSLYQLVHMKWTDGTWELSSAENFWSAPNAAGNIRRHESGKKCRTMAETRMWWTHHSTMGSHLREATTYDCKVSLTRGAMLWICPHPTDSMNKWCAVVNAFQCIINPLNYLIFCEPRHFVFWADHVERTYVAFLNGLLIECAEAWKELKSVAQWLWLNGNKIHSGPFIQSLIQYLIRLKVRPRYHKKPKVTHVSTSAWSELERGRMALEGNTYPTAASLAFSFSSLGRHFSLCRVICKDMLTTFST